MSIAISTPPAARAWTLRVRNAGFLFGVVICGIVVFAALFGNALIPHDPFVQNLNNRLVPPFWMEGTQAGHLLGTDQLGRDYLARLVYGARISLLIGLTTMIVSGLIGITIGTMGGYFGGIVDDVVMFLITCRLSIPVTLVALAVVGLLGSSLTLVLSTLGLLLWDRFAVVARSTTMQVRNLDYVSAAVCAGSSTPRLLFREILPNIAPHLAVVATLEIALAILLEAALSFLGLGVPAPLPSWGLMIAEGRDYMFFSPWVIMIPGVTLFIFVMGVNFVGDGLRSLLGAEQAAMSEPLLDVENMSVTFGGRTAAVRDASFRHRPRRDALHRRRIRLRQVGQRARGDEPAGQRRKTNREAPVVCGRRPAGDAGDRRWRACAATAWR